jgi:hypothetical protein
MIYSQALRLNSKTTKNAGIRQPEQCFLRQTAGVFNAKILGNDSPVFAVQITPSQ